jgi:hypothetical protein
LDANYIDFRIEYAGCEYLFSIYDIFNLFDIKDFGKYYFEDCNTEQEIKYALDKLTAVIEKYRFDIEKAGESEYFEKLKSNFEADWTAVCGEDWKEEIDDDDDNFDMIHPSFTLVEIEPKKLYKELSKRANKNKLETLYEKRLYEYLSSGGNTDDIVDEKEKYDKEFSKQVRRSNGVLCLIAIAVSIVVVFVGRQALFGGALIPNNVFTLFGHDFSLASDVIGGIIVSSVLLSYVFIDLFGKKMFVRMSKDNSARASQKYDVIDIEENKGKKPKKILKRIGAIASIFAAICVMLFVICDNIGLYDTYAKYLSENTFVFCKVDYENIKIYSAQGYYNGDSDDEDAYVEYEYVGYIFADDKGNYYDAEEISPNSKAYAKINQIIDDYNIEVETVKSIEDIPEY